MTVAARVVKVAAVGVVIVLALVVILTALRTELPRSPGVMSDALGPDAGEPVAEYVERAGASLAVGGDDYADDDNDDNSASSLDPEAPRWALVSADRPWTLAGAEVVGRDLPRVSALLVQVPVDGVAMPVTQAILAEPVAGEDSREPVFDRGLRWVADSVDAGAPAGDSAEGAAGDQATGNRSTGNRNTENRAGEDRGAAAAALTTSRIRSGEPAIIGLLVRGTPARLRSVAQQPGVRAVEALPADAVWGRFAVRPLQPQQIETASPLPDTAPVTVN